MTQSILQRTVNTFIKGLITEANGLTFPENASVDELNCTLQRDGSRSKRLGIEYEDNNALSSFTVAAGQLVVTKDWVNVGGQAGLEYLVVQVGHLLYFYDKSYADTSNYVVPTSDSDSTPYVVNLNNFASSLNSTPSLQPIEVTSINGSLIVVSKEINSFIIEKDLSNNSFTETEIVFRARDFSWQGDRKTYDEPIASGLADVNRQYDTKNSGWSGSKGSAALSTYISDESTYPALSLPWFSGKNSSGNFSTSEWLKIFSGTTVIANGHYILNLYEGDRQTASGLGSVTNSPENTRFSCTSTYAGRVWYAGLSSSTNSSRVFFSQLLDDLTAVGDCYQINDPTSEEISDLIDTDGGFVNIPEANDIQKLHVFGASLLVFASNGVWSISGVDDIFRATGYSVNKLTSIGISQENSFISAEGRPYWWSHTGIHTLIPDEIGILREQNLSVSTVQTFWENISATAKQGAVTVYDATNKKIIWMYPDDDETITGKLNNMLIFDEVLGAFHPWKISDSSFNSPYILGASFYKGYGSLTVDYDVLDSSGNQVEDSSNNPVIVSRSSNYLNDGLAVKFLTYDNTNSKLTFSETSSNTYLDWGSANYEAFAEAAYDFSGDTLTYKNLLHVLLHFEVIETGWEADGSGGYQLVNPAGCMVSAFWDFKSQGSSQQQGYRLKRVPVVNTSSLDSFDYPDSVISTKLRIRGRGRSFKLRFEGEEGKGFKLLGWETLVGKNDRV